MKQRYLLPFVGLSLTISGTSLAENAAASIHDIDINNQAGLAVNSQDFFFRLNGRLMVDFDAWHGEAYSGVVGKSGSGSEIRRSRIYLKGKYHDWQYRFQTNINRQGASNSNTYIKYSGFESFDLYVGKHAEPLGLESANSSKFISAIERSVTGNSHFAGDRELGVSIAGYGSDYAYQLGVFDIASTATDNNYAITGRLSYLPLQTKHQLLHLGMAISVRDLDQTSPFQVQDRAGVHSTPVKSITTDSFYANSSQVYNFELSYQHSNWHITGEYQLAQFDELGENSKREFSSHYLQASYFLTGDTRSYDHASGTFLGVSANSQNGAWEVFTRVENVNFLDKAQGSAASIVTSGINYFATKFTRLSLNYTRANIDYGRLTNNCCEIKGSALSARAQFYW